MKTINALSARSRLGTILDEVSQEGVHYIIKRLSEPLVVVVPFKEYEEVFKQNFSKKHQEELLQELSSFRKKYGKQLSGKKGTTQLLHNMRDKRARSLVHLVK
ncbi:type II toxin-antitoxin system Phd/YefM family antitoxin [Candidatus Gottesmanbacteria bacterium]|nr:type II toxin-antitoxin system Phd/YefM family antitoxin [Candidatus Gottesmanbacteria bacterium]MBI3305668.1 type II toxin-antitoxin system Phd/YefM family antitoxin [Candidatus Nomurabacteria bacterium]